MPLRMNNPRVAVLAAVTIVGCRAAVSVPTGATFSCTSNADCPQPLSCQTTVNICVNRLDKEPPQLLSASATDPRQVLLTFSEPVDLAAAASPDSYSIDPLLSVSAAELLPDARSVRLLVDAQRPGFEYTVTVNGVVDLVGNAIAQDSQQSFTGFGATPDRRPPEIVAPAADAVQAGASATLVWARRAYASYYTVDVALDAAFSMPTAGSPYRVDDPGTSVSVPITVGVRHYWRVRANTTAAGEYSTSTFQGIADTLYVYCPNDASTCDDSQAVGNQSRPYQSISEAVVAARALGVRKIRVAARGGGAAYSEHVVLDSGLDVRGGYTADFSAAARDISANPTVVESAVSPAVLILGAAAPTVFEGFSVRGLTDVALQIEGTTVGPLQVSTNDIAAKYVGVNIRDGVADASTVVLEDNNLHGIAVDDMDHGVEVISAGATLRHNTVTVGTVYNPDCEVACDQTPAFYAKDSDVVIAGNTTSGPEIHFGASLEGSHVVADGNLFAGQIVVETGNLTQPRSFFTNNVVIVARGANLLAATGLSIRTTSPYSVSNNLIYVSNPSNVVGIYDNSVNRVSYTNNIVITAGAPTGQWRCYNVGLYGSGPEHLHNNLLLDCAEGFYVDDPTFLTDINDVNNLPSAGGNITLSSADAVGFASLPQDFHLTATTPAAVAQGGLDTSLDLCGAGTDSCGDVTHDLDGAVRTCAAVDDCYSLGPYELDPP